jgi:hypothetical protein
MRFSQLIFPVLTILALSGGSAEAKNIKIKYRGLDQNNNGVITRDEWRGNDRSFDNQDWNGDHVLSGDELRRGARRPTTSSSESRDGFYALDDNGDGYITPEEWENSSRSFDRLDRNSDRRLTRAEYYNRSQMQAAAFSELDANADGWISRNEWRGTTATFTRLDTNGDYFLSKNEFNGRSDGHRVEQLFQDILGRP